MNYYLFLILFLFFYFIIHYYLLKPNIFKEKSEIESFENFIEHMGNFNDFMKDTTLSTFCPSNKNTKKNKQCKGVYERCINDSNGKNNCCDQMNCILNQDNFNYKICSYKKDKCLNYDNNKKSNYLFNWKWKWEWKKTCK